MDERSGPVMGAARGASRQAPRTGARVVASLLPALLGAGWVMGWAPVAAAAGHLPATRDAVAAVLFNQGFSSVATAKKDEHGWSGEGVRHGVLMRFTIDDAGRLGMTPAK